MLQTYLLQLSIPGTTNPCHAEQAAYSFIMWVIKRKYLLRFYTAQKRNIRTNVQTDRQTDTPCYRITNGNERRPAYLCSTCRSVSTDTVQAFMVYSLDWFKVNWVVVYPFILFRTCLKIIFLKKSNVSLFCLECVDNTNGLRYMGTANTTRSGRQCQAWAASTPHKLHRTVTDDKFLDGSRAAAKNYCRCWAGNCASRGPWCYTADPNKRSESCDIPSCSGLCMILLSCLFVAAATVTRPKGNFVLTFFLHFKVFEICCVQLVFFLSLIFSFLLNLFMHIQMI